MGGGELLTKVTVWIAVGAYAGGALIFALGRGRRQWDAAARLVWTLACAALVAHAACAFHFHHAWSHRAAYLDTARQTRDVFGANWGGGLFVNYALLAGWAADVGLWWAQGLDSYRRRPRLLSAAWHGFLLFIVFNGAVVFVGGAARWAGLAACAALCLAWRLAARDGRTRAAGDGAPAVAKDSHA